MTSYILRRRGCFLNDRYQWTLMPHSFPEWQFGAVLETAMQYKDRPQHVGETKDGDLDRVVWQKI